MDDRRTPDKGVSYKLCWSVTSRAKKDTFYNKCMFILTNLPQNLDKIPNSKGPGTRTKNGCDSPGIFVLGS